MKKFTCLSVAAVLLFCTVSPAYCAEPAMDKEKLKAEINKEDLNMRDGADTFWTGVIVGSVSAATLVPVGMYLQGKDEATKENLNIVYIMGGAMGGVTLLLLAWGGTQWLLAGGRMNELKKMEESVTINPYLIPSGQNRMGMGLGINIRI